MSGSLPGRPLQPTPIKLINLTSHNVRIYSASGHVTDVKPSGITVRVKESVSNVGALSINGNTVPVTESVFGDVSGLPESRPGVLYIVSRLVAEAAAPHRNDLVFPDQAVKQTGEGGSTVYAGCRSLSRACRV